MERILVAIDNETASQKAVDWAIRRTRQTPCELRVVSIDEDFWEEPPAAQEVMEHARERIIASVPAARLSMGVLPGPVLETLVATSSDADIIVLGSHRLQPVRSALAGSLPLRVASRADCVTVIVPEDWQEREGSIIVGLGNDWTTRPALEWATAEAARLRRPLEIVHAWHPSDAQLESDGFSEDLAVLTARHEAHLAAAVARAHALEPRLHIESRLVTGEAGEAISLLAAEGELVVIGTHHHSPLVEWVVAGTGQNLVRNLAVPVAIVPSTAEASS